MRPALSRRSRAGPLPTACPTTCGPRQPRHRPGGREADTDEEQAHAHPGSTGLPTPGRTAFPCKAQLRISGVFAPFGHQQCHSGGALSPRMQHALARDRANKRGIAAQREALWGGAVHHEVKAPAVRSRHSGAEVCVSHC